MVMKYADYYRHFGVRRAMQMVAPTLSSMQSLTLPRESVLHYLPEGASVGIPGDDFILRHVTGPVYAEHVLELSDKRGNPRSSMVSVIKIIRDYHRKYRRIRQLHDLERGLADKKSLIIENYAILPQLYRYPANIYRSYSKWWNIQSTFWDRVGKVAAESQRPQFVECRLPSQLPSKSMLIKGAGKLTTRMLTLFPEHESLFILELWKWLGPNRHDSMLAKVKPEALNQLNLIWIESGQWFVINMGLLDSWRMPTAEEQEAGAPKNKGIPCASLQNRFLRLLMFLIEARTAQGGEAKALSEGETVEHTEDGTEEHHITEQAATIEVDLNKDDEEELVLEPGLDFSKLPVDAVEETVENNLKIDALIERDLEALDHLHVERELSEDEELTFEPSDLGEDEPMLDIPALRDITLKEGVMAKADQLAAMDLLSGAEYKRFMALSEAYTKLPDPYGGKSSLVESLKIHLDDLKIAPVKLAPSIEGVMDPSMLHSTLAELDPKYIKHVMPKDIGNSILGVQKAGIAVTGYRVEEHHDAMNHYEGHHVQLTPVRGKPSTVHFRIPKINEDGTFIANGTKYRLSRQWSELPIRKVNSSTVALTSYYGKVFVQRSEKKVANYAGWITNQVAVRGMDTGNTEITDMMLANVYDSNFHVPRIYSTLAQRFRSFTVAGLNLFFDYEVRKTLVDDKILKAVEAKKGFVLVGTTGAEKSPIVVGDDNVFYQVSFVKSDVELKVLGSIEELLGLDVARAPREVAEIKLFGKLVPVGIFLSYHLGFQGLLKVLGTRPVRHVQQGEHAKIGADEFVITFEDEKLVFAKSTDRAGIILQGLATYNEALANYAMPLFEKKAIYFNIMERMNLGVRYLREMDLLVDLFIDPITKEILEKTNEPITFIGLVLRACDLLLTDWSPDETDTTYQRLRGYERMAGAVYSELARAVRQQRARGTSNAPIDISPYAVWQNIMQDSAVRLVEESNPVHELKAQEEVTYSGTGGRTSRSMVGRTRIFHPNDLGVISESTKDSSDVAITTYTTANPHISDVRGMTHRYDRATSGPSSLISTSALLAPAADRDDPKRVNFIAIQNSSTTFSKAQRAMPLRTGYERVIAHRTSALYAATAKQDGVVSKVSKGAIEVTYKDGTIKTVELGRRFGNVAGITIPHELTTALAQGDKVKEGDILAYNSHFFELDALDKTQALWKQGVLLTTAILECPETLEDSSAISKRAAKLLETQFTKVRDIVIAFDQSIHEMVAVGSHVEVDSILCTIEDPITADNRLFDEASLDTLKLIAANTPKAKVAGVVERVEVFYHGDVDDLSPSLQELAQTSDMNRKRRARELREVYTSGRVDDSMRIEGNPLISDHVCIRVYITIDVPAGEGDKGVVANQMKTIFGRVLDGTNETQSGEPIDVIFGYKSISDRIVSSPEFIGTTNTLLQIISQRAAAIYRGKK
jgi:hypothetical protein